MMVLTQDELVVGNIFDPVFENVFVDYIFDHLTEIVYDFMMDSNELTQQKNNIS